jgi:hypothetical protein
MERDEVRCRLVAAPLPGARCAAARAAACRPGGARDARGGAPQVFVPTTYKELTEEWQQTAAARVVKLALALTVGWPVRVPPSPCRVRGPAAAPRRAGRFGSAGLAVALGLRYRVGCA